MTNVISFPETNQRSNREWSDELLGTIRAKKRVQPMDRSKLALNIGEAIESLGQSKLQAAREVFTRAWGAENSLWSKRPTLVRFPAEKGRDPYVNGSYVSAGPTWAKLLETTARVMAERDEGFTQGRFDAALRRMVMGTEFLPKPPPLPKGADGARRLLQSYAGKLEARISASTRLEELFNVLATAPFGFVPKGPDGEGLHGLEGSAAAFALALSGTHATEDWAISDRTDECSTNWAMPTIYLGTLAKTVNLPLFLAPAPIKQVALNVAYASLDDCRAPEEGALMKWLEQNGAKNGWRGKWALPEVQFSRGMGHGWTDAKFDITRDVVLRIASDNGKPKLQLAIDGDDTAHPIPASYQGRLTSDVVRRRAQHRDFLGWTVHDDVDFTCLTWPEWIDPNMRHMHSCCPAVASDGHEVIGFLDTDYIEWNDHGLTGGLSSDDDDPIWQYILGAVPDVRFVSAIEENAEMPAPCRFDSIGAALLRNLLVEPDARLPNRVHQKALEIGEAGCLAHEAILDSYASAIDGITKGN